MRIQTSHHHAERGLDAYFSPPEATAALLAIEHGKLPRHLWEPAAGNGAIVRPLRAAGFDVVASDLVDYDGAGIMAGVDYLTAPVPTGVTGIVTNPPFKLAIEFARKALDEVPYLALLLRTNFLESTRRLPFFRAHPPARVWNSSRRLPMMHRHGWTGPTAPSNTHHAWFIWDASAARKRTFDGDWFDWQALPAVAGPHWKIDRSAA
jgi:hypothetical protein